jgi:hypothetical protein
MKKRIMTESEMRESKVPWPKTLWGLMRYIRSLIKRPHDYGTCVYAMSMAALATFYYVSAKLGTTGFQASYADLDFLRRSRHYKCGFRIIDYEKLLYPQYLNIENFPTPLYLLMENKKELAKKARQLLQERDIEPHPDVKARWEYVASLDKEEIFQ